MGKNFNKRHSNVNYIQSLLNNNSLPRQKFKIPGVKKLFLISLLRNTFDKFVFAYWNIHVHKFEQVSFCQESDKSCALHVQGGELEQITSDLSCD